MTIGDDLSKVLSSHKQIQLFDILQAIHPTHAERLFLVGFLKYTGYTIKEVLNILNKHAEWEDYSQATTQYQVESIFKQPHHNNNNNTRTKPRVRKWSLTPLEELKIKYARAMEAHRINEQWMKKNNIPIYDAAPKLRFDPSKMELNK